MGRQTSIRDLMKELPAVLPKIAPVDESLDSLDSGETLGS